MKKLLAMVLALVMTLSLAVSASAFKDDKDVSDTYAEAVAVLNGMGVFKGYEDGSFKPQGDITRAEVAAIVYRVYTADVKDAKASLYATYNKFSDMTGAGWAAGYIGYCANAELVKGYPNGTFQPSGKVTGYEVLAMILRAIGYDKNGEFSGADWALHVAQTAQQAGVLDNVKGVDLNAAATRELVAELLFRAIAKSPMVTYTAAFGYQTVSFSGSKNDSKLFKDNETLGHKNFDLTPNDVNGDYGRPATKWTYNVGDEKTTVYDKPVATYTEAVTACDLCKDLSEKKEASVVLSYTDGVKSTTAVTYKANDTKTETGAQGQLTEVYENGDDYTVIYINTYLAKVTKVIEEVKDKNDHVKVEASVNVDVYGLKDKTVSDNFETTGFAKNDYVLVTYDAGDIASMEAAKNDGAKLTGLKGIKTSSSKTSTDVKDILAVAYEDVKVAEKATLAPLTGNEIKLGSSYTFYYDSYGNVIGVGDYNADANYVVIDRIWAAHNNDNGDGTVYANLVNVSDASAISKVVVDSIKNADGTADNTRISTLADNNGHFYENLMTYTVNKDGEYELTDAGEKVQSRTDKDVLCTYDASENKYLINVNKDGKQGDIYMDKDTEILFQYTGTPDATYKAYTLDNLPNSFWGYVEWVEGSDGKADVLYVRGAEQAFSYVFVASTDYETREQTDDSIVLTLKDAYYLNEDGSLSDKTLTVTSNSENIVVSQDNGKTKLESLSKAGLYKLYTLGENDQLLEYVPAVKLTATKNYAGNNVVGLYDETGNFISVEDTKSFAWSGDFEGVDGNAPYSKELTQLEKSSELSDINAGDYVYIQKDADKDKDIVAIHKINLKVSVTASDATNATVTADDMYYGGELKSFEVSVKAWNEATEVKMNGTDASSVYTLAQKDADAEHSSDRVYTVTAAKDKTVNGNIVVTIAAAPKCDNKGIVALNPQPTDITNFTVSVTPHTADARGTITVTPANAEATVKLNDLMRCIKAEGEHVDENLVAFDNSLANKITNTDIALDKNGNVAIAVYSEAGEVAYYNVVFATPAA